MADKMTLAQVSEKATALQNAANEIARFRTENLGSLNAGERGELTNEERGIRRQVRQLENEALDIIWDDLQTALQEMREATDKMRAVRAHLTSVRRTLSFAAAVLGLGVSIMSGNAIAVGTASLGVVNLVNDFREEDDAAAEAEDDAVG